MQCCLSLPKFQQLIKSCWDYLLQKKYKHSPVNTAYSIGNGFRIGMAQRAKPEEATQNSQCILINFLCKLRLQGSTWYSLLCMKWVWSDCSHKILLYWILERNNSQLYIGWMSSIWASSKGTFFYLFFRNNPISLDSLSALASSLQCIKSRKLEEIKVTQNILGPQLHEALSRLKAVVKNVVAEHLDKTTLMADFVSQMWQTAWIKDQKRKKLILKLKYLFGNWLNFCGKLTYLSLNTDYLLYWIVLKRIMNTAWYSLFFNVFKLQYLSR